MKFEHMALSINAKVRQNPDQIAIRYENQSISYRSLELRSNKIANYFYHRVNREKNVLIILDRSPKLVEIVIGLLKAGLVFVPLDPLLPAIRVGLLLKKTVAQWIITSKAYYEKFEEIFNEAASELTVLLVDGNTGIGMGMDWENLDGNDDFEYVYNKYCYIYFTSGTTGVSKGVLGRHRSLAHFIQWEVSQFEVDESFNIGQLTRPSFEPFLRDVFVPLMAGGTCCIPPQNTLMNPEDLIKWMGDNQINLIHIVPSLFKRQLLQGNTDANCLKYLKYILLAGELVRGKDISRFIQLFDHRIQLVNLYGPAETTMSKFYYYIKKEDASKSIIPVGKGIDGAQALILDEHMQPCLTGNIGEVYIRTPFISSGYFNSPKLTKRVFIRNPFSTNPQDIIYKSGDLGRVLPDGNIELVGRMDNQIKVRGVRIEASEIENQLMEYEGITDTVVTAVEDEAGEKYLCVHFTAQKEIKVPHLKEYLFRYFPAYMIPSYFVCIDKMPLTSNGKINHQALAKIAGTLKKETIYEEPRSDVEKQLLKIWKKILNVDKIGTNDDFFELGGQSLDMMKLAAELKKEFDTEVPIPQLYSNANIKEIARIIVDKDFEDTPFVLLNNNTKREKLFCFPPYQSFGFQYQRLASSLPDYSFYAFNFLEEDDIVTKYVDMITGIQPEGPYVLMGWSAGGLLTFEVAKKLESRRLNVSDIVLIDCTWQRDRKQWAASNPGGELDKKMMREIDELLNSFGMEFLSEKIEKRIKKYLLYRMKRPQLEAVDAHVHFIASEERTDIEESAAWEQFTNKSFTIHQGVGPHNDMLEPGYVENNSEIIGKILDKIFSIQ